MSCVQKRKYGSDEENEENENFTCVNNSPNMANNDMARGKHFIKTGTSKTEVNPRTGKLISSI